MTGFFKAFRSNSKSDFAAKILNRYRSKKAVGVWGASRVSCSVPRMQHLSTSASLGPDVKFRHSGQNSKLVSGLAKAIVVGDNISGNDEQAAPGRSTRQASVRRPSAFHFSCCVAKQWPCRA